MDIDRLYCADLISDLHASGSGCVVKARYVASQATMKGPVRAEDWGHSAFTRANAPQLNTYDAINVIVSF